MPIGAPLVSVVIPAYNRADLLPRAVASAQAQNFDDLEIVIVDDGSRDATVETVNALSQADGRIRLVRHERNRGEAAARNTGVRAATGQFVAFLDSDDEWLPGKLNAQIETLRAAPASCAATVTGQALIGHDGTEEIVEDWTKRLPINSINLLARGCGLGLGNTFVTRAHVFAEVGLFDESLPLFVDLDWLCRFTARYEITRLDTVFIKYHKATMRSGEFVEDAVAKFYDKNRDYLNTYSVIDRARIRSQFYNYVSLAYAANGPWRKFVSTRFMHFLFNPFQHVGNYVHFLLALTGIRPVGRQG